MASPIFWSASPSPVPLGEHSTTPRLLRPTRARRNVRHVRRYERTCGARMTESSMSLTTPARRSPYFLEGFARYCRSSATENARSGAHRRAGVSAPLTLRNPHRCSAIMPRCASSAATSPAFARARAGLQLGKRLAFFLGMTASIALSYLSIRSATALGKSHSSEPSLPRRSIAPPTDLVLGRHPLRSADYARLRKDQSHPLALLLPQNPTFRATAAMGEVQNSGVTM